MAFDGDGRVERVVERTGRRGRHREENERNREEHCWGTSPSLAVGHLGRLRKRNKGRPYLGLPSPSRDDATILPIYGSVCKRDAAHEEVSGSGGGSWDFGAAPSRRSDSWRSRPSGYSRLAGCSRSSR